MKKSRNGQGPYFILAIRDNFDDSQHELKFPNKIPNNCFENYESPRSCTQDRLVFRRLYEIGVCSDRNISPLTHNPSIKYGEWGANKKNEPFNKWAKNQAENLFWSEWGLGPKHLREQNVCLMISSWKGPWVIGKIYPLCSSKYKSYTSTLKIKMLWVFSWLMEFLVDNRIWVTKCIPGHWGMEITWLKM